MSEIRILLADDHTVIRSGLRLPIEREPDFRVVAEAEDGRQAVELSLSHQPHVVVMDALLNGIEATRQIVARNPRAAIVVLSMHSDESYVLRALKAGARAYLLKDSAEEDPIRAIRAVSVGKSFFSPAIRKTLQEGHVRLLDQPGMVDSYGLLTTREREIPQLIAEGKANKEISVLLN